MPEIVLMQLDPDMARTERDPEIQQLLRASAGLNLALDYLPGALGFDALDRAQVEPTLASAIVWFDAYISNVDRSARNPNMLFWKKRLWLIDHGAALYYHHTWEQYLTFSRSAFSQIREHVLLPVADALAEVDSRLRDLLSADGLAQLVALIPDLWLNERAHFANAAEQRAAYVEYLGSRLDASSIFVAEAIHARAQRV